MMVRKRKLRSDRPLTVKSTATHFGKGSAMAYAGSFRRKYKIFHPPDTENSGDFIMCLL